MLAPYQYNISQLLSEEVGNFFFCIETLQFASQEKKEE